MAAKDIECIFACPRNVSYLIGGPGKTTGFVDEGEDRQSRCAGGAFQQIQALLVVDELHIAPVDALPGILLLQGCPLMSKHHSHAYHRGH